MERYKPTLEKVEVKLRFQNYAETTINTYLSYTSKFLEHFNTDVYHIPIKDAQHFLEHYNYTSRSQQNQFISAVKFLYANVLGYKLKTLNIKRPRKQKKQPRIIDAELLAEKIKLIENLKHRAILTLGLSCGLRVSEVVNLRWDHLNRKRNIINIIGAKGNKDRAVVLNDNLITLLEDYYREFRSKKYVFNGQSKLQYTASSIQKLIKKYIDPKESFHCLRHAYSTYAIDNGTELKPLSVSLGHNSTKTVERYYFHQSTRTLSTIKQAI